MRVDSGPTISIPSICILGRRLAQRAPALARPTTSLALQVFTTGQNLSAALKPFPFQTVSDSFGYVGNSNYHALQAILAMRTWHGLT